ncbi:unnamed protein product [Urochloa decumbens]|uniref:VQ domain-containing protein n=1 Tax=Urochloa decumbens TaxID=240449 RepID=A0ABC8YDY7_9POAL
MNNSNKTKAGDGQQAENLLQQPRRQSANLKAPEERPFRRRIKPPPAKVHHVHPARFRRFVQRHTCCLMLPEPDAPPCDSNSDDDDATASTSSATANLVLHPPADGPAPTDAGCLDVTRKSMQEAYMAWCSSNDIPLSPGTMAELSFTEHPLQ